jgi:hypothetical protein
MNIKKVLRTLTPKFDHTMVAKEESTSLDELKFEELQAPLEAHELRLTKRSKNNSKQGEESSDQVLQDQYNKEGKIQEMKGKE